MPSSSGWRFLHTPGHSPGHISLFRDEDRVLIAGDAVITIDQQNPVKLVSQIREFYPPPRYFTPDWQQAYRSVQTLADLRPDVVATGHGLPISGEDATRGLIRLLENFWERAPKQGRYLNTPALADAQGTYYTPPKPYDPDAGLRCRSRADRSRHVRDGEACRTGPAAYVAVDLAFRSTSPFLFTTETAGSAKSGSTTAKL